MPDVVRIGRAMGSFGVAPRHDLDNLTPPHSYCLRWFPWRRIAPASHQPRNVIHGEWTDVRVTADCHRGGEQGGRRLCRARRREDDGGLCTEEPAGCLSSPSAGSHCLNGLPVHRSIVAGRRGQANGGEPAVRIGNKTEWPAFMAASRSRRGGRHLIPSRVLIKGHTGTLRARAGYCPEVATPACRSRVRASFRSARPVPACRQAARPTPLRGMPPRRLQQHRRDRPGCVRLAADRLWSSVRCTT